MKLTIITILILFLLTPKLSAQELSIENADEVLSLLRRKWKVDTFESNKWPDLEVKTKEVDLSKIEFLTSDTVLEEGRVYLMWWDGKFLIVGKNLISNIYYEIIELTPHRLVEDMYLGKRDGVEKLAHVIFTPVDNN